MTEAWATYAARLDRVRAYIFEHLDERLDLMTLADVACLSHYHWHRIYLALHGESVADTVKRLRLHRAAGYLANTPLAVTEVARLSGYPNLQSFTRIFKSVYGMPPAQYRSQGTHAPFQAGARAPVDAGYAVEVKELAPLAAVGVLHRGAYMDVGRAFGTLFGVLGARGLAHPGLRMAAVYGDDPSVTPEAELQSMACVLLDLPDVPAPPLQQLALPGGPHAVLRHTGPYATMKAAYDWLYGDWLPQSGREPADGPVLEFYLNSPQDTVPADLATEICLPLRA